MSGDNFYGRQPIKFYSEDLTLTKVLLIKNHFKFKSSFNDLNGNEEDHVEIKKLLTNTDKQ